MTFLSRKHIITLFCLVSIFLAIGLNGLLSANQKRIEPPKSAVEYPIVSVSEVVNQTYRASVNAYGEVRSRNQLNLTTQVSGKVIYLSDKFLSGNTLKKGELLTKLEPIVYQQALADAKAYLAETSLTLAQEKLNSQQAAEEWQQSGLANEQASELVLRKPQLAAAKASYQKAVAQVDKAKYDLAQTQLKAPFDALVVSRSVQMGSNLQAGNLVAELYDTALFEVSLPLSQHQWQLLPFAVEKQLDIAKAAVTLTDENGLTSWHADVGRTEQHIDTENRQRSLIAEITNPIQLEHPLFPGTFVQATIKGISVDNLWKLPASALIDDKTVWSVDSNNQLEKMTVNVVFAEADGVYVKPLVLTDKATIVSRPLASYLAGMKVEPQFEQTTNQIAKEQM